MTNLFDIIIYTASVLGATATITSILAKLLNKKLTNILAPVQSQIHKMDVKECRRFLIDFLVDIEHHIVKNEVQWKFAHEVYDHYTKDLNENSYVKDFWERVVSCGNNE